jgi:hypothetical protein
MKPIKEITVHPGLGNDLRDEVIDWCRSTFVDDYGLAESDFRWWTTSNYNRSYEGTFDVFFKDLKDAHWFIIRWGGEVVNVQYEDVPEQYVVLDEIYNSLFK